MINRFLKTFVGGVGDQRVFVLNDFPKNFKKIPKKIPILGSCWRSINLLIGVN